VIREFTLAEERIVAALAEQFQAAVWIVTPAFRRGLDAGVRRAIAAAEAAAPGMQLAAVRAILGDDADTIALSDVGKPHE